MSDESLTKVVPLDVLKRLVGVEATFTDDDQLLADLENEAADFVNGQTERNWGAPVERTVFRNGLGTNTLFLLGHIEDPAGDVVVRRRDLSSKDFDAVDVEDYARRGDTLVLLGGRWSHRTEYEVTFTDGYTLGSAPGDIQALIADLVGIAYLDLSAEGVKSETIGDYSYTLDTAVTAAAATLSDASTATLNRYRAAHV